jgi:hypothetical protein
MNIWLPSPLERVSVGGRIGRGGEDGEGGEGRGYRLVIVEPPPSPLTGECSSTDTRRAIRVEIPRKAPLDGSRFGAPMNVRDARTARIFGDIVLSKRGLVREDVMRVAGTR